MDDPAEHYEGERNALAAYRETNKALGSDEVAQRDLVASIHQVRAHAAARPWTLEEVARLMPHGPARETFTREIGDGPQVRAPFTVDLDAFDHKIKFRVFKLENGITVSSPFLEVGEGVTIETSEAGSILTATGLIKGESIRTTP